MARLAQVEGPLSLYAATHTQGFAQDVLARVLSTPLWHCVNT